MKMSGLQCTSPGESLALRAYVRISFLTSYRDNPGSETNPKTGNFGPDPVLDFVVAKEVETSWSIEVALMEFAQDAASIDGRIEWLRISAITPWGKNPKMSIGLIDLEVCTQIVGKILRSNAPKIGQPISLLDLVFIRWGNGQVVSRVDLWRGSWVQVLHSYSKSLSF